MEETAVIRVVYDYMGKRTLTWETGIKEEVVQKLALKLATPPQVDRESLAMSEIVKAGLNGIHAYLKEMGVE